MTANPGDLRGKLEALAKDYELSAIAYRRSIIADDGIKAAVYERFAKELCAILATPPSPGTLHGELRNPIREWDDAVQTGHMALASHPAPDPGMREAVARVACESWGYDWETENSAHKAGWREMIDRIMALVGAGGLRAAAEKLYDACLLADVRGELAENIDGSLLDAVQLALGRTPPQKQSWICPTCGPVPDDLVVKRNGKYRHYRQPVVSDGELCGPVQKQGDAP